MATKDGGSKLQLPITDLFGNRFCSNLNCRRKIKCVEIKSNNFQNGGQDCGQNGGSTL